MRLSLVLAILAFAGASPAWSLVDNADTLYVNAGESITLYGAVYKNVSIVVRPGGRIALLKSSDPAKWSLQLVAPTVYIGGTISAYAASLSTQSQGLAGGSDYGPGGSGHGGRGGNGHNHSNSGGNSYNLAYRETPGSKGLSSSYGGGGSIRIDAISLTLTSTAVLDSRAYQSWLGRGGSGGCVYLNGIHTYLQSGYCMDVSGGSGVMHGYYKDLIFYYGGGGGGGGRIKIMKYPVYQDGGGTATIAGGAAGGGTATNGSSGSYAEYNAFAPAVPTLLAPDSGQEAGRKPTFNFYSSDTQASQFFQYEIQVKANTDFSAPGSITLTANQLTPDPGWQGVPFFKSGQMAAYTMPFDLTAGQMYYWRVRVTNNCGATWTSYSISRHFTVVNNYPPNRALLVSPASGQGNVGKTPAFQVLSADPDGNSLTFSVTLSLDPGLSNPTIFQSSYPGWNCFPQPNYPSPDHYAGITATCQIQAADALAPGATYYWQAVVYDQYQETTTTAIGNFTVVPQPPAPNLVAPADQTVVTLQQPTFTMATTSATGSPLRYQLDLTSDEYQTVTTFYSQSGNGWTKSQYDSGETAALTLPAAYALAPGVTYTWRVMAYDVANDLWSPASSSLAFTVVTPPLLPKLIGPEDNHAFPDQAVTLEFSAVSDAGNTLTYRVDLCTDPFHSPSLIFNQAASAEGWSAAGYPSGVPARFTFPASAGLQRGKTYWWRAAAYDGISWGPVSDSRAFTIADSLEIRQAKIYPSPAVSRSELHLAVEPTVNAEVFARIFNSQGKEIRRYTWQAEGGRFNDYTFNIQGFAADAYYAVIELRSSLGTKKTVKRFAIVN